MTNGLARHSAFAREKNILLPIRFLTKRFASLRSWPLSSELLLPGCSEDEAAPVCGVSPALTGGGGGTLEALDVCLDFPVPWPGEVGRFHGKHAKNGFVTSKKHASYDRKDH